MELYLRCKECKLNLAGPLELVEKPLTAELSFHTCFTVNSINFDQKEYYEFDTENEDDLVTHPQWYDSWYTEWEDRSEGADNRRMFVSSKRASYGCCGPFGKTLCSCGAEVGRLYADCVGLQWMLFSSNKIERSDFVEGLWNIHSGNEGTHKWIENIGRIQQGVKNGEWEVWSNTIIIRREKFRNKEKKTQIIEILKKKLEAL